MYRAFQIAGSGLLAQKRRMDMVAMNLANALTTKTPEGGPYRKQSLVTAEMLLENSPAGNIPQGTMIAGVLEDQTPPRKVYEPAHPDADQEGFVEYPGFSPVEEMAEMLESSRGYEANLTVVSESKALFMRTLDLGRSA